MNKSYLGKEERKHQGQDPVAEEQGEPGNPFKSRPMWQERRDGESNAWDEAGEVGRSPVTEVFTGC